MLESVKTWWRTVSTVSKLILAMVGAGLLSALALLALKGRRRVSASRQDTFRRETAGKVADEQVNAARSEARADTHLAQAEVHEEAASRIDVRLQAARERVDALKKELGNGPRQ